MPSLKLSNPFRRHTARPTLRERAAALKATAGRVLRRPLDLPAPGSDAARDAFAAACREHSRLTVFAREGYPELQRTPTECWSKDSLGRALNTGEVSPADYARLYPIASERELRVDAITHRLNIGALNALAYADSYPAPTDVPEADEADALTAAILDGWAAWGAAFEEGADLGRANDRRDELIAAAEALPASARAAIPKALACAWMEWVAAERPGQPRSGYDLADRIAFDVHASAMLAGDTAAPHPDAALIALEAEFLALDQSCLDASEAMAKGRERHAQIRDARTAAELDALKAAYDAANEARRAVLQRAREITAQGVAGLAVKARIATTLGAHGNPKSDALHHAADDDWGLVLDLMGDVLAVAGPASTNAAAEG